MGPLESLGIKCLELDVTKGESVKRVREQVAELTGGKLDILVNNAGRSYSIPFSDQNMDEIKAMFDVNVFGVMMVTQEFLNLLIASGDGRIVNIGSIAGIMPYPFGATYSAAKAGIHAFGNTLRQELAPFNVKVITVITGGVKSNIGRNRLDLPPDSLYYPMRDDFITKRQGRSQAGGMATDAYARAVVAATLKESPGIWLWKGHFAFFTWFIDTFFPHRIWDILMPSAFGLDKFKNSLRNLRKSA
ncbi:hypothetical protein M422DRAFT_244506 [Sphaerobolus stellatus SS14]|nr:hypothetical protein M422DRAFT_244506 [Sphaerobolus stellatus SS14]